MLRRITPVLFAVALVTTASFGSAAPVHAQAADLTGKFVLKGPIPTNERAIDPKIELDFDGRTLTYETLVVEPRSKGIANILVYVTTPDVPITDAAARGVAPQVVVDVKAGQFHPRTSGLWIGKQRLLFRNSSELPTNVNFRVADVNPLIPPMGKDVEVALTERKAEPQPFESNIYVWMRGYILPRDNPYFAVTAGDGTFKLRGLPAGVPLEFQVWHEESGFLAADPQWKQGRFTITLAADVDLGTIEVPVERFRRESRPGPTSK